MTTPASESRPSGPVSTGPVEPTFPSARSAPSVEATAQTVDSTDSAAEGAMNFPLPPLGLGNPLVIIIALSVVAGGASAWTGHVFFAVWFFVGGLLAVANAKLVILKVGSATADENPRKAPVAVNAMVRLGLITVVALVVAYFFRPDGLGVMFGLAVGQVVLVLHSVIPVLKGLRKQS